MRKNFKTIIVLIIIVLFVLYILFLGKNEKYDFIPFVLGSFAVFGIYIVKNVGKEPEEWNG